MIVVDKSIYGSDEYDVIPVEDSYIDALSGFYENLGLRLKKAREDQNYTLVEAAKVVNLTPTAIANYEAGIRHIPIHTLLILTDVYNKPLQFFLGLDIYLDFQLSKALQKTVGQFTDTIYAKMVLTIEDGKLINVKNPPPLIPLPPEIAQDHSFLFREYNPETESYNYTLFKFYKPIIKEIGFFIFKKREPVYVEPNPDDLVIAEIGDTKKLEMVHYKNVTPTNKPEWQHDPYSVNVIAVATAKIERLVKK